MGSTSTARVTEQDNMISFNIDSDDNIYAVYNKQNRIEKFSPDGELLWTADCNLNYKPPFTKNNRNLTKTPANRLVSWNINIDSKNRIWINTAVQYRQNRNIPSKKMFEIYDCDGILLTMLEHPRNFKTMRRIKNSLFLFDFSEESVYEYRTIEK